MGMSDYTAVAVASMVVLVALLVVYVLTLLKAISLRKKFG